MNAWAPTLLSAPPRRPLLSLQAARAAEGLGPPVDGAEQAGARPRRTPQHRRRWSEIAGSSDEDASEARSPQRQRRTVRTATAASPPGARSSSATRSHSIVRRAPAVALAFPPPHCEETYAYLWELLAARSGRVPQDGQRWEDLAAEWTAGLAPRLDAAARSCTTTALKPTTGKFLKEFYEAQQQRFAAAAAQDPNAPAAAAAATLAAADAAAAAATAAAAEAAAAAATAAAAEAAATAAAVGGTPGGATAVASGPIVLSPAPALVEQQQQRSSGIAGRGGRGQGHAGRSQGRAARKGPNLCRGCRYYLDWPVQLTTVHSLQCKWYKAFNERLTEQQRQQVSRKWSKAKTADEAFRAKGSGSSEERAAAAAARRAELERQGIAWPEASPAAAGPAAAAAGGAAAGAGAARAAAGAAATSNRIAAMWSNFTGISLQRRA